MTSRRKASVLLTADTSLKTKLKFSTHACMCMEKSKQEKNKGDILILLFPNISQQKFPTRNKLSQLLSCGQSNENIDRQTDREGNDL